MDPPADLRGVSSDEAAAPPTTASANVGAGAAAAAAGTALTEHAACAEDLLALAPLPTIWKPSASTLGEEAGETDSAPGEDIARPNANAKESLCTLELERSRAGCDAVGGAEQHCTATTTAKPKKEQKETERIPLRTTCHHNHTMVHDQALFRYYLMRGSTRSLLQ